MKILMEIRADEETRSFSRDFSNANMIGAKGSNEGPHRYSNLNLEEKKTQTIKQRIKNKYLAIEKVNCYCFFVHLRTIASWILSRFNICIGKKNHPQFFTLMVATMLLDGKGFNKEHKTRLLRFVTCTSKLLNVWLFSNYLNILFHNMIVMCNYTYFLEINLFLKHFSQSRMSLTSHD
ncbi:hypothetical protein HKD37_09G024624 [Glycine soja]